MLLQIKSLVILAVATLVLRGAETRLTGEKYFRFDGGLAREPGSLPDDLDAKGVLTWRVPLDPGHSTPILNDGRLFLTTWKPDSKQLATVAIDAETGKILWRTLLSPEQVEQIGRAHV